MTKKKQKPNKNIVRVTLAFPTEVWERITLVAESAQPKLSGNQVAVLLLDYASKDIPKIRWIFETLPEEEKNKHTK